MSNLTAHIKAQLAELVRRHRVVVWYDPGATLRACLPEALPDGVQLFTHDASYLALRVAFEEANPRLEQRSVLYIGRTREEPSWLRDLELAGCCRELGLSQVLVDSFALDLEPALRDLLAGSAAARLAVSWDDLVGSVMPSPADLRRALIAAALGLSHRPSLEDLVLEFVSREASETRLSQAKLLPQLHALLTSEMGWPLLSADGVSRQAVAAALLLSEAVKSGGVRADGLEQVLPDQPHRAQWAAWADKWRRLDPRSFENLSAEVEKTYSVGSRLGGSAAASVQSFRSVDAAVLADIEKMVGAGELRAALAPAQLRAQGYWAEAARAAGSPQPWDAVLAALEVRLATAAAGRELADRRAWSLSELLDRYCPARGGWWRIDDAYRRMDAHRNRLPQSLRASLGEAAARAYVEWVDALGAAASVCLAKGEWKAHGWRHQGAVVSAAVAKPGRTAVILADALRFDLGMSLCTMLEERALKAARHQLLGALPSVTQVGMAAILSEGAAKAEIRDGRLLPRVGGMVLSGRQERLAAFQRRFPHSHAVELGDVRSGRWKPKKTDRIETLIVYMQDLDEQGDFLPQVGSDHFGALVKEIAEGVDALTRAGYSSVLVIPDHGFLLLPEDFPPRTLQAKASPDTARARRYLVGKPPEVDGTVRTSLDRIGWDSTAAVVFPIGAAVFGIPGEPSRYMHGGPTLQETALLALVAERVSVAAPVGVRIVQPKHIDTTLPRFVLEGDPGGRLLTEPRRVRVIARSDGNVVGESEVVTVSGEEAVEARLGLQHYGTALEVIVEDFATREVLDRRELPVELPAGYEDL